jgi:hypothetical protein
MAQEKKAIAPPPKKKGKEAPPVQEEVLDNLSKTDPEKMVPLNFRVPASFRKAFKQCALDNDTSAVGLLYKLFEEYRNENRQ